jgi:hypothetical protein
MALLRQSYLSSNKRTQRRGRQMQIMYRTKGPHHQEHGITRCAISTSLIGMDLTILENRQTGPARRNGRTCSSSTPLPSSRKFSPLFFFLYSSHKLSRPLASSMFAPGVPRLMKDFNSTNIELASFVVSIYILGFAIGPLYFSFHIFCSPEAKNHQNYSPHVRALRPQKAVPDLQSPLPRLQHRMR